MANPTPFDRLQIIATDCAFNEQFTLLTTIRRNLIKLATNTALERNIDIKKNIRLILGFAFVFLLMIAAAAGLYITESVLSIWDSLQTRPGWFVALFAAVVLIIILISLFIVSRLLFPAQIAENKKQNAVPSEADIESRIKDADEAGVDVQQVRQEIEELSKRRTAGSIFIAVFGEVNMGKSSIIRAILPDAQASVSLVAGTTTEITHYHWQSSAGDELILADVPGTEQVDAMQLSTLARNEALRSHIVIYVCDGDLNRSQYQELQLLSELKKPIIIALNKSDVYNSEELQQIQNKLKSQLSADNPPALVSISCGRQETVVRIKADGSEENISRKIPSDVTQLTQAIQHTIDSHENTLDQLRDTAVFVLAAKQLEQAEAEQREQKAKDIVSQYTKRAIVGSMAAVSPGTDIVVQAYLGTSMVKAICEVYRVPVRDFDIDTFLKLVQSQVGRSVPVILAIAGNGLKAFPGIGTLAGGLVHATAYGLIFDTLGKTLVRTLSTRNEFQPAATARVFQETLSENLEQGTTDLIKTVLAARKQQQNEQ